MTLAPRSSRVRSRSWRIGKAAVASPRGSRRIGRRRRRVRNDRVASGSREPLVLLCDRWRFGARLWVACHRFVAVKPSPMKLRLLLLALASSLALRAADALPLFNGTLAIGRESRFLLVSVAGKTSPWLKLGDTFEGFTVKAYDAKTSTLDLESDGKISHVTLASDAAVSTAPVSSAPATLADAE